MRAANRVFGSVIRRSVMALVMLAAFGAHMAAQAPMTLRQTADAATLGNSCVSNIYHTITGQVDPANSTAACTGRPTTMTMTMQATLPGSYLVVMGLNPVQGCIDSLGQTWVGNVDYNISTQGLNGSPYVLDGFVYFVPPANGIVEGITSVTCDVTDSFLDISKLSTYEGWKSATGYQWEQALNFYEFAVNVPNTGVNLTFGTATEGSDLVCRATPPKGGAVIDMISIISAPMPDNSGAVTGGTAATSTVAPEGGTSYLYDYTGHLFNQTSGSSLYALKSAYAADDGSGTQAAIQCGPYQCYCSARLLTPIPPQPEDLGECKQCQAKASEPVNLTTGNVYIKHSDYVLPGLAGGMSLERTWNSFWAASGAPSVKGLFGHSWQSTYDESLQQTTGGNITYWRADGSAWKFAYNSVAQSYGLVSPANERGSLAFNVTTNQFTLTFKDGTSHIFSQPGQLLAMVDRNGNRTSLAYTANKLQSVTDAAGRVLSFAYGDGANPQQVTQIHDAAGVIATYTYDSNGRLQSVSYPDGSGYQFTYNTQSLITAVLDPQSKVIESHTYAGSGKVLRSSRANGVDEVTTDYSTGQAVLTDSKGNTTTYLSQRMGGHNVIGSLSGPGCDSCGGRNNQQFTYDAEGNVLTSTDALNHQISYAYDSNNNVVSQTYAATGQVYQHTYNGFSEILTSTDPLGNVTTNAYDAKGNLLSVTSPATPAGRKVPAASVTSFAYDAKGEVTKITDPLGNVTSMTYTPAGLVATITDAQNNVTHYEYDARGNRTAVVDALGNRTTFIYDGRNRVKEVDYPTNPLTSTTYVYDVRGRRTSVTDQNGRVTNYAYDDADRLVSVTDAQIPNGVTHYAYDTENNLSAITDALGRQTSFVYDALGRVKQVNFPSTLSESYVYDAIGNLLSKTDRNGHTISYSYDGANRLTQKTYPDTTAVHYTYDADNRMTQVTDATGTYQFAFDNMGRLTQTTTAYSFLAGKSFAMAYTWDAGSNLTQLLEPDKTSTSYAYDTLNRLTSLSTSHRDTFTFTYDALGRRTSMTRPNGVVSNYQYDSISRLLAVLHQVTSHKVTSTIDGASYTYDAVGNRTSRTDQRTNTTSQYGYDPIYQLTSVLQGANTTETYSYDPVGNRLSSLGVPNYAYDSSNQLTSQNGTSYAYDNNGNMVSKTDLSGTTQYTWDFENRLTSVQMPGGNTVSFKYDPFGKRIQKVSAAGTKNYVYDGANIVEELDSTGAETAHYSYGKGVDEPLELSQGRTNSYYEADALGSITSLTDDSGALAKTYTYDSFGRVTNSTGTIQNPFQYTGRILDPETGLLYYRARYYDPAVGRFMSEDPMEFAGSGTNFYAYVRNEPVNLSDPFGLCPKGDRTFCLGTAYARHGISLGLDVLGFIPGEGIVKAITQIGVGVVSTVYSATQLDTTGSFLGIAGIHLSAFEPMAVEAGGSLAKAVPILSLGLNVVTTGNDIASIRADYLKCMNGETI